jgi:hypothetical protein
MRVRKFKELDREIRLYESFNFFVAAYAENNKTSKLLESFEYGVQIPVEESARRKRFFYGLYLAIAKRYPIIKTRLSESIFESWAITHTVDDLKKILKIK